MASSGIRCSSSLRYCGRKNFETNQRAIKFPATFLYLRQPWLLFPSSADCFLGKVANKTGLAMRAERINFYIGIKPITQRCYLLEFILNFILTETFFFLFTRIDRWENISEFANVPNVPSVYANSPKKRIS